MKHQIAILLLACLAFELSQAWLIKLPKLEDLIELKKEKEQLKKLDFLNLFTDKSEKKENEWAKIKQWFEEKKLKELDFFEALKEKKEEKLEKKAKKKIKSKAGLTTVDCYDIEPTTEASYAKEKYQAEEEEEAYEEEEEQEVVASKPQCDCKVRNTYESPIPTAYDVRENYEDGERYFT